MLILLQYVIAMLSELLQQSSIHRCEVEFAIALCIANFRWTAGYKFDIKSEDKSNASD